MSTDRSPTADRETERIVRSWLTEGTTRLPDRVLDAVLDEVPSTPQRRAWWPARRSTQMNNALRIAIAAAAVLVVAFIAINVLPGLGGGVGSPVATPSAAPSPSTTAAPTEAASPLYGPGSVAVPEGPFSARVIEPAAVQLDMPSGWESFDNGLGYTTVLKDYDPVLGGMALSFDVVKDVFANPCDTGGGPIVPPLAPTVDALADHLAALPGMDITGPTDVTISGYAGKYLELTTRTDLPCTPPHFYPWVGRYLQATGELDRIWILDVDGTRLLIDAASFPNTTAADQAELQAMIESIRITPAP